MRNRIEDMTRDEEDSLKRKEIEKKGEPERERTFEEQSEKDEMDIETKEFESDESDSKREKEEVRKKIENIPDKKDENENCDFSEEKKLTPVKFSEETEKKEEKFYGSTTEEVVNFVRDTVSNLKVCEGAREGFAEIVSDSIIEVLTKAKTDEEKLLKIEGLIKIEEVIDVGGGYGDNLKAVIGKIKEERKNNEKINGVCLDNKTSLSKGVEKDEEITGSYQDANETSFKYGSFDLVMATHLLQEIKGMENKKNVLREMARISKGKIVLMIEFKRSGFDGRKDKFNHFINNFNFKYDVLEKKEYEDIFEKLGFTIEAQSDPDEKSPNKITYLLKINKEETEQVGE